jgi:exonuclease III
MRIATYNVNGINGRLGNLLGWLDETAPDIVCLQELKAPDEKFPAPALRAAGYGAVWHGQKSWNGVAILARGADPVETTSKARFWARNPLEAANLHPSAPAKRIDHAFVAVAPWWCRSNALSDARLRERPREEAPYVTHI